MFTNLGMVPFKSKLVPKVAFVSPATNITICKALKASFINFQEVAEDLTFTKSYFCLNVVKCNFSIANEPKTEKSIHIQNLLGTGGPLPWPVVRR